MGVVVEGGACGGSKRAAQGMFRRWKAQSGVSGSSVWSGQHRAVGGALSFHNTHPSPAPKNVIGFEFGPNVVLIRSGDLELP